MSKLVEQSTANLRTLIIEAIGKAITAGQLPSEPIPDFTIEVPADRSHGGSGNQCCNGVCKSI